MNKEKLSFGLLGFGMLFILSLRVVGQPISERPPAPLFYWMEHTNWPPVPMNVLGLATYWQSNDVYVMDDSSVDSELLSAEGTGQNSPASDWSNSFNAGLASFDYGTNLWLEITGITNGDISITAHNTQPFLYYQLLSKTNLTDLDWFVEAPFYAVDTDSVLDPVPEQNRTSLFFWAAHGETLVGVRTGFPDEIIERDGAITDSGLPGTFEVYRTGTTDLPLTVHYHVSGAAADGVDYTNNSGTVLSGSVTLPVGESSKLIYIHALRDTLIEPDEAVTLTITLTNEYLVDPEYASASILILDDPYLVVARLSGPVGIDYHPPTDSLLVSYNFSTGNPRNFSRVDSNGMITNWSTVHGCPEEIKITTAKSSVGGFTNGTMYFGNGNVGGIGWLSGDGSQSNLTWCTLPNEVQPLRGGLYLDQSGSFNGNLIAVTSDSQYSSSAKSVWQVASNAQPTLLATLNVQHLEGVITLTNDVPKWGPWAGKILTGNEVTHTIYAVDTNGTVTNFDLGINPEDFDIIPPNQDLYCASQDTGTILKLSRSFFAENAGDLLITQAGELTDRAELLIVHWNAATTNFVVKTVYNPYAREFEHVTFAPMDIPSE